MDKRGKQLKPTRKRESKKQQKTSKWRNAEIRPAVGILRSEIEDVQSKLWKDNENDRKRNQEILHQTRDEYILGIPMGPVITRRSWRSWKPSAKRS